MYTAKNKVRMHDTDMAGILYFARQFRFVHDTLEDWMESEGLKFEQIFHDENFVFVIIHCEADYFAPVTVGDTLEIQATCEKIGNTSFTLRYLIFNQDGVKVGAARTVHVCLAQTTREKISIPQKLKKILAKHLEKTP